MKKYSTLAIFAAAILVASPMAAQELKTANFLDNYLYGYRINPSVTPYQTSGFFGIGASNVGAAVESNFGVSTFLFPQSDGTIVTGLNKNVPSSQFPGKMEEINRMHAQVNENVLSFGFTGSKGHFNTFEINLVSDNNFQLPRSFFEAFKNGSESGTYDVKDLALSTSNYLELALGRSSRKNNLAIGWRIKGLVGVAKASANVDMTIVSNSEQMAVRSQGTMEAAAAPITIGQKDGYYDFSNIGINTQSLKPAGYGAALDLGVSYYLLRDKLVLGAAVRNLGAMKWTTNVYGQTSGTPVIIDVNDTDNLGEKFQDMIKFAPKDAEEASALKMLPMSFNLSAKYKPISLVTLGAAATINKYDGYLSRDIRLGGAFTPFRQLNIAGSYSFGDQGQEVGVAASIRLLGINIYAGIDSFFMRVTPQYIPIDPVSTTLNAGLAIAFGKSPAKTASKKAAKEKKASKKKSSQEDSE